jgi:S-adenosylmethionine synthetase
VAYAIGVARPMGVYVTTFGTGVIDDEKIAKAVRSLFDFRPAAIIETLDLLRPIYSPTAAYGHFGRTEKTFTWERTDRAEELAALLPGKSPKALAATKALKAPKAVKAPKTTQAPKAAKARKPRKAATA